MTLLAELDLDGKRIMVQTRYAHRDLMRQVPGATWSHKDNAWKVPVSWGSYMALKGVLGEDLQIGGKFHEWVTRDYETRVKPIYAIRQALNMDEVPDGAVDAQIKKIVTSWGNLYSYQQVGAAFMTIGRRVLLIDEMGTGKSITTIYAMRLLYELGENPFPALIIGPNSMKKTWEREVNNWWPGLTVQVIKGSAAQRRKQLETPAHIYVMNWEGVRGHSRLAPYGSIGLRRCKECGGEDERVTPAKCEVHKRELNYMNFQTVVADECHRMKDPKSKQTRAIWSATGDAPFRFGLTGTPVAQAPDDVWTVAHWLEPKEHPSRTVYIDRYCEITLNAFGTPSVIGLKPQTQQEFFHIIDPRLRRMPKSLVLPFLPPITRQRRDIEMGTRQKKAYEQMRDKMIAELEDDGILAATSPLTRVTRLLQFSSAFAELVERWDERTGKQVFDVRLTEPSNKIDAFFNDLPDFGDDQIVVFAQSRQLIEMLSARMEKEKLKHGLITGARNEDQRQEAIDEFQAGKIRFMLCTVQAGGVGLTLTKGRIAVFLQRSWSNIDNKQAEARIHRIGSEIHESVLIIDYVSEGTIEEDQIQAIYEKSERLEQITRDRQLLKRILRGDGG